MGSFGDRLKKEREQRGVSLDDISLHTKIGTRLLRALEEEKFDQLPGGIFNKGFVRAYARHLGLDEEQAVADYLSAAGVGPPKPEVTEAFPVPVPQERSAPAGHAAKPRIQLVREPPGAGPVAQIPWGILAIVLLVIALAIASWSYFHRQPEVEKTRVAPVSNAENAPLSDTAAVGVTPARTTPPPKRGSSAATPIPTTEKMSAQGSPVEPAALRGAEPLQATSAGRFTVILKGNDESQTCWVSIEVDGQPATEAILSAPTTKTIQARDEMVLKAGSVGALDIYFNGKKLPPQGGYGIVKTLRFRNDGLQPAPTTPAPTP